MNSYIENIHERIYLKSINYVSSMCIRSIKSIFFHLQSTYFFLNFQSFSEEVKVQKDSLTIYA